LYATLEGVEQMKIKLAILFFQIITISLGLVAMIMEPALILIYIAWWTWTVQDILLDIRKKADIKKELNNER
jgi:hypothetical protein